MIDFHRIAVLGPGLLGGSLALAVQRRHPDASVMLWGRNPARVTAIRQAGYQHVTTDLKLAIEDAELVVLAVPVGAMEALGRQLVAAAPRREVFLTDVGSVKVHPHQTIGRLLQSEGLRFAGSHPMAGSEQTGFEVAKADLFEGAPCIITNDNSLPDEDLNRLLGFWAGLGARTVVMTASEHDRLVARLSHLPHVLAVVCTLVALEREEDGRLAGGGLRDTSRVAGGDPLMWTEILLENRAEIVGPLRESAAMLSRLADLLEEGKEEALSAALEDAQRRRTLLNDYSP